MISVHRRRRPKRARARAWEGGEILWRPLAWLEGVERSKREAVATAVYSTGTSERGASGCRRGVVVRRPSHEEAGLRV